MDDINVMISISKTNILRLERHINSGKYYDDHLEQLQKNLISEYEYLEELKKKHPEYFI